MAELGPNTVELHLAHITTGLLRPVVEAHNQRAAEFPRFQIALQEADRLSVGFDPYDGYAELPVVKAVSSAQEQYLSIGHYDPAENAYTLYPEYVPDEACRTLVASSLGFQRFQKLQALYGAFRSGNLSQVYELHHENARAIVEGQKNILRMMPRPLKMQLLAGHVQAVDEHTLLTTRLEARYTEQGAKAYNVHLDFRGAHGSRCQRVNGTVPLAYIDDANNHQLYAGRKYRSPQELSQYNEAYTDFVLPLAAHLLAHIRRDPNFDPSYLAQRYER